MGKGVSGQKSEAAAYRFAEGHGSEPPVHEEPRFQAGGWVRRRVENGECGWRGSSCGDPGEKREQSLSRDAVSSPAGLTEERSF